jgi:hypothetical protein
MSDEEKEKLKEAKRLLDEIIQESSTDIGRLTQIREDLSSSTHSISEKIAQLLRKKD